MAPDSAGTRDLPRIAQSLELIGMLPKDGGVQFCFRGVGDEPLAWTVGPTSRAELLAVILGGALNEGPTVQASDVAVRHGSGNTVVVHLRIEDVRLNIMLEADLARRLAEALVEPRVERTKGKS